MSYKRGDVVILPFPYTDQSGAKRRPALVLSSDAFNARRADIIVAPITSNLATGQFDDTPLTDWSAAGLLKPSVVKGIRGTVQQTLVIRVLGTLTAPDLQKVEQAFANALALVATVAPGSTKP
jgi:mRNA interferase MazF